MRPIQLFDPVSSSYSYLLCDEKSRCALMLDPVATAVQRDLEVLRMRGLQLLWCVETHVHADHITGAALLAEATGARIAAPLHCGVSTADRQVGDGGTLSFGTQSLQAIHTPGHTPGSTCYRWHDNLFTGDTLLIGGCGRTDFQSGDSAALYRSLTETLFDLPDATLVWPGHDYRGRTQSTIGIEKHSNGRVAGRTLEEFVALMARLDLPRPKSIDEAIPANLQSGRGLIDAPSSPPSSPPSPPCSAPQRG